jgi:NTP pyrophosphatase (non-canonical NTP hydrolase)
MNLNDYQADALSTCFPSAYNLNYLTLNLTAEAGEVAGAYAKYVRDGTDFPHDQLVKELGDVLWQTAVLAHKLGMDLSEVAEINLRKLADRKARNVLSGAGDDR